MFEQRCVGGECSALGMSWMGSSSSESCMICDRNECCFWILALRITCAGCCHFFSLGSVCDRASCSETCLFDSLLSVFCVLGSQTMWSPDAHFTTLAAAVEDEGARTASAEVRKRSLTGGDADFDVTSSFVDWAEAKIGRKIRCKWPLVWCSQHPGGALVCSVRPESEPYCVSSHEQLHLIDQGGCVCARLQVSVGISINECARIQHRIFT